jgi:hypothetical protein
MRAMHLAIASPRLISEMAARSSSPPRAQPSDKARNT